VKFAWIQTENAHYPIHKLCGWLAVTPSGFYAWCTRPESARAKRDRTLAVLVQASFDASQQRYGSPRIHEDLLEQQERVSRFLPDHHSALHFERRLRDPHRDGPTIRKGLRPSRASRVKAPPAWRGVPIFRLAARRLRRPLGG
jgi:hypothetical protein